MSVLETTEKRLRNLERQVARHKTKIKLHENYIAQLSPMELAKQVLLLINKTDLVIIEARIKECGRRMQIEILKQVVMSEVARLYPESWGDAVKALDNSDEWWYRQRKATIREWVVYLKQGKAA